MTTRDFEILFKETRLNLEPASTSSIVQHRVTSQSSFSRAISSTTRTNSHAADDEKGYRSQNLASASSIYYRKYHSSPKAFHCRVLENDTVLSIRTADVCKQTREPESPLVLNLRFASPIRTSCIGFADPQDHDALCVFVVDQSNQLHAITLRPEYFRKKSATEAGLADACKTSSPPGFGFKYPYRLVAVSSDQLIVTMHDGGILRFDRNRAQEGERALTVYFLMLLSRVGTNTIRSFEWITVEGNDIQCRRMGPEPTWPCLISTEPDHTPRQGEHGIGSSYLDRGDDYGIPRCRIPVHYLPRPPHAGMGREHRPDPLHGRHP